MTQRIGVLVIEENRLLRDALAALLGAQPDFTVVAAVPEPAAGLTRVQETKPHVVLVGASLGNRSSHRFVESVRAVAPESSVVVVDLRSVEADFVAFVRAGAAGFVSRPATDDDVVATVRSVAGGAKVVPPALTSALFSHIAKPAVGRRAPAASDTTGISKRERGIVDLIGDGLNNREIAERLGIATDTVKGHVHHILKRLALHNRLQIAAHVHRSRRPRRPDPKGDRSR